MKKKLIVIVGPTGIGKTTASIQIAKSLNTEIISSDSRQIFKELSIGTAVPSEEELATVPHHFIHSHTIHNDYNASKYEHEALQLIEQLFKQYEHVVMVGGSMLYIDAVCKGIDTMPDVDPKLRATLKEKLEKEGIEALRLLLKQLDPLYYQKVDLKNPVRIMHALEICLMTGKPFSHFRSSTHKKRPFQIIKIGLNTDRQQLHERINTRVDKMMQAGLLDEAKEMYPHKKLRALNTVGYKEIFEHLNGDISLEKAVELIKRNTRRYARKQLTWFRKEENIRWFEPNEIDKMMHYVVEFDETLNHNRF